MSSTTENTGAPALQLRKILLPTDFSGCGNYALPYAAAISRAAKTAVICIHVVEPIVPAVGYSGLAEPMPIADMSEQLEDSAERELPRIVDCEDFHGLDVEEIIVHGDAAAEIVRVAKERDVDLGIQRALERLLVSPQFLYRIERDPAGAAPGAVYSVSDIEPSVSMPKSACSRSTTLNAWRGGDNSFFGICFPS